MDRLKGKVAIITGAAGGICHKASELFCQEGAKVVMADIDPQVEQFSAEINANGGESIAVVADVAQRDTWVKLKKLADEKYGRIDTVVNGAAAFSPPDARLGAHHVRDDRGRHACEHRLHALFVPDGAALHDEKRRSAAAS